MFENSVDLEFKGPIPPLLSNRVGFQDGDHQQNSSSSVYLATPVSLVRQKTLGVRKSEYQSVYDNEEILYGSKPQFLKTIIAKSLQSSFITNLWNKSYLRKLKQLSAFQIQQLDDLQISSDGNEYSKGSQLWRLLDVFTPYSKFIACWDAFQILTFFLIFFWLPYKISFEIYQISQLFSEFKNEIIEYVLMIILALDIGVSMNLAFIEKGQIIKDRKRIIVNYFNKYAFVDLVKFSIYLCGFLFYCYSPILYAQSEFQRLNNDLNLSNPLCCLLSIEDNQNKQNSSLNLGVQYIYIMFRFLNLSGYLNDLVGLLKVLMVIVSVVHICGCIWHGIAYYNTNYSWLDAYNLRDKSNASQYNVAIYWAMMTMTTVGYGDITAKNDLELLINNLTMFIGSIVFAYSVNSIGIFVTNMYKGTIEYSKTVSLINTYMRKNKIQFELQTKVRSYLEYIWQEEQEMNDDEVGSIVNKLSKNLQEELQYQLRGNILKNCKIIMKLFSESFIKTLLHYMEEQAYSPEERIITVNELDDCSLYIITKGEVELIFEGNQIKEKVKRNTFKNYHQFDCFGELAFFTGNPRTATAISKGFTRVFKMSRETFLTIISSFPDDYEKFCEIRDRIQNGEYGALYLNCFSCQSNTHLIKDCNYLHFNADKEKVIKKENYPFKQDRNQRYQRRFKGKCNAWINSQVNEMRGQDYLNDTLVKVQDEANSPTLQMNDAYENDDEQLDQIEIKSSINENGVSVTNLYNIEDEDIVKQTINYQRKFNQPKQTVQTAGFGSGLIKDSYKEEYISQENCSENQDQFIISIQQPQITLVNQNNPQYTLALPLPSLKKPFSRSASNDDHNIHIHRLSIDQRLIKPPPQKSDIDIRNLGSNGRVQMKRTNTNNIQALIPENNTYINQGLSSQAISPMLPGFDKMHIFLIYQPQNNYDLVIKNYAKEQRFFGKKRLYPEYSVYSFFYAAIIKGWKLRRLGEFNKAAKSPNMIKKITKLHLSVNRQRSNIFKEIN